MSEEFEPLTEDNLDRALAGEPIYLIGGKAGLYVTPHHFNEDNYVVHTPSGGILQHSADGLFALYRLHRRKQTVWYALVEWSDGHIGAIGPHDREVMRHAVASSGGRILAEHSIELPANG